MKKWIKIASWCIFVIASVYLTTSSIQKSDEQLIKKPIITVHVSDNNPFVTSEEIEERLRNKHLIYDGNKQDSVDINAIEKFIHSISQVKDVEVFEQLDGNLNIDITLRQPVARIFNKNNESYYLDKDGNTMSTTHLHTARVLIFSGEINDKAFEYSTSEIINNDSLKSIKRLDDIYRISKYVCNDPFLRALIGQVYVEKNGDLILTPIVGDQKIVFGTALNDYQVKVKFEKLKTFYTEAMPYEGWNTYKEICLKYKDQIVCKKK